MTTRGLYVFKHDSELGCAHAHALFDRVQVARKEEVQVARGFSDYDVTVDGADLPAGVTLIRRV
jgi:CRISPR-associated protein Csd2